MKNEKQKGQPWTFFMKKGTTLTSCTVCVLNNKNTDGASTICGFSMEKMNPEKIKHVDMLQRKSEGYNAVDGDKSLHVA